MTEQPDLIVLRQQIAAMSQAQKLELTKVAAKQLAKPWLPQPGPQYTAFHHPADELLYGGAAGGGKTDLVIGLASTAHYRSLIFRRQANDLDGLWERMTEVLNAKGHISSQNSVKKRLNMGDGRIIEMGHLEAPGSEKSWQGRPHDLIAFDEAAQLDEFKINFVCQWLRTTKEGQRCRVVFATNPPVPDMRAGQMVDVSTGDWIKRWFAPWVDRDFPDQAEPGEIRWCIMRQQADRMETIWVDGPGWYVIDTGKKWPKDDVSDYIAEKNGLAWAKSRAFVRSLVRDNAYLRGTGYVERLSSKPEPLRSMLMSGVFGLKMEDHEWQIIPTAWVVAAQERWRDEIDRAARETDYRLAPMRVLAADIAQGGMDSTVLAPLRDNEMFDRLRVSPGKDTPDGPSVVSHVLAMQENGAMIVLDGSGGWGGSTRDLLKIQHNIVATMCVASAKSTAWTDDMNYRFLNLRSEMWWKFREALDPMSDHNIMLPPSDALMSQLVSMHYGYREKTIVAEAKDDVRKRIGTSTDEADAVIMAWHYLEQAKVLATKFNPASVAEGGWNKGAQQTDPRLYTAELADPLDSWDVD